MEELLESVGIVNDLFSKNTLLDFGEGGKGVSLLSAIVEGMSFFCVEETSNVSYYL